MPLRDCSAIPIATTRQVHSVHAHECAHQQQPSPPPQKTRTLPWETLSVTATCCTYSHSPSRWALACCRRSARGSRKSQAQADRCSGEAISTLRTYFHICPQFLQVMGHCHGMLVDRYRAAHLLQRLKSKLQSRNTQEIGRTIFKAASDGRGNSVTKGAGRDLPVVP